MAMSVQMQQAGQQPTGEFAAMAAAMATPQGKKGPAAAGLSPGAKRPLDRSTFIRQAAGIPKPMDMPELNAGFHNLAALQHRDEGFSTSLSGCIHFNACLLNDTITHIEKFQAELVARVEKVEAGMGSQSAEMNKQRATVESLSANVGCALDHVNDQDIIRDATLRAE